MNRYSPCIPVSMVRSSFDSLLASTTAAPAIALPLGSVTAPCTEVDEVCGKTVPLTVRITRIENSKRLARFMVPSPAADSHAATNPEWQRLGAYHLPTPPSSHTPASVRIGLRQSTSSLPWKLVWERHDMLRVGSLPGTGLRLKYLCCDRRQRESAQNKVEADRH